MAFDISEFYVYLSFDIYYKNVNVGNIKVRLHKITDIEKWKNPDSCKKEAVSFFVSEFRQFNESELTSYYVGDLIPKI